MTTDRLTSNRLDQRAAAAAIVLVTLAFMSVVLADAVNFDYSAHSAALDGGYLACLTVLGAAAARIVHVATAAMFDPEATKVW